MSSIRVLSVASVAHPHGGQQHSASQRSAMVSRFEGIQWDLQKATWFHPSLIFCLSLWQLPFFLHLMTNFLKLSFHIHFSFLLSFFLAAATCHYFYSFCFTMLRMCSTHLVLFAFITFTMIYLMFRFILFNTFQYLYFVTKMFTCFCCIHYYWSYIIYLFELILENLYKSSVLFLLQATNILCFLLLKQILSSCVRLFAITVLKLSRNGQSITY